MTARHFRVIESGGATCARRAAVRVAIATQDMKLAERAFRFGQTHRAFTT